MSRARSVASVITSGSGSGSGTETYTNIADLPLSGNETGAQAFVSENNRLYIWTGTGWYNIALINTTPTAITGANGSYQFASDGTPIVLTLVSTDPEGLPITWSYAVTSGSLENGGGTTATVSQAANVFTITPTTTEDYAGEFSLTFTASDGVNLATATSSFTLQFAILNSKYTTLMLKTSGTNAQQNNTFVDSSTNNFTITRNGNATQGTFSPYGDKWSNYFGGVSGNYLATTSAESSVNFGTSDFTVEFWLNANSTAGNNFIIDARSSGLQNNLCILISGGYWLWQYAGSNIIYTNSNMITVGTWNHVVFVRSSGTLSLYVNGVFVTSATDSTNYASAAAAGRPGIGGGGYNTSMIFNGAISNLRIVKGTAIYTNAFTPATAPLTAVTGTSLLTCQSNRFKDSSANNYTVTPNGSVSVQRFSPFDLSTAYDASVIGGSGYFDGSGDYLSPPSNAAFAFGTEAYTVEAWVYRTATDSDTSILFSAASATGAFNFGINPNGALILSNYGTGPVVTGNAGDVPLNSWCHIVAVRSSTSANDTKLYANGVLKVTGTDANTWTVSSSPIIGGFTTVSNYDFIGYISNLRIVKGTAVYTSNFTPPTEPLTAIANTSLLLNMTNAGIYDTSGNNDIQTVGNAQVSTAVTKYGSSSMYFDGTGDNLTIPATPSLYLSTGDFTIEFWFNTLNAELGQMFMLRRSATTARGFLIALSSIVANKISFYCGDSSNTAWEVQLTGTTSSSSNIWYHCAVVRSGNNFSLYLNGVLEASTSSSVVIADDTANLIIGSSATSEYVTGYISDLRITKGLARYTANFTPPTSALLG